MPGCYNKVVLAGRATAEPVADVMKTGYPRARFGLAVNDSWKRGDKGQATVFIDCVGMGNNAKLIGQLVHKGTHLLVDGRLRFDQWKDPEGRPHSRHSVTIDHFVLMGKRPDDPTPQDQPPVESPGDAEGEEAPW
jgi:single-strand DNA-binding protein